MNTSSNEILTWVVHINFWLSIWSQLYILHWNLECKSTAMYNPERLLVYFKYEVYYKLSVLKIKLIAKSIKSITSIWCCEREKMQ